MRHGEPAARGWVRLREIPRKIRICDGFGYLDLKPEISLEIFKVLTRFGGIQTSVYRELLNERTDETLTGRLRAAAAIHEIQAQRKPLKFNLMEAL